MVDKEAIKKNITLKKVTIKIIMVEVEGAVVFDGITTAAGEHRTGSATVGVRDGRLTVVLGGTAGFSTLNFLRVTEIFPQPFVASFNFQPFSGAPYFHLGVSGPSLPHTGTPVSGVMLRPAVMAP